MEIVVLLVSLCLLLYTKWKSGELGKVEISAKKLTIVLFASFVIIIGGIIVGGIRYSQNMQDELQAYNLSKDERATYTYSSVSNKTTSSTTNDQRCSYCAKVIFSDGRAIHATHEYNNVYSCDYCGFKNIKE